MEAMLAEREDLRHELQDLKNCQVRYFSLSITATGALIGLVGGWGQGLPGGAVYLAPLVIVLPCWWIFFDKATTITRIVGYLRVLESCIIAEGSSGYDYVGWENALSRFRQRERWMRSEKGLPRRLGEYLRAVWLGLSRSLLFRTDHRYWVINWYTFFGLAAVSLYLSRLVAENQRSILSTVFMVLFVFMSLHNVAVLGNLTRGASSYDRNEKLWREVLTRTQ